ncbi:MAG: hypothetical protein HY690_07195 [Chloroflexi bacterium]|nr:hypothetical protein [Chloroflexota bacterium]
MISSGDASAPPVAPATPAIPPLAVTGLVITRADLIAGAAGGQEVLNLIAGGDGAGDLPALRWKSASGTVRLELWTDAANGYSRLKSAGTLALHAGNVGFTGQNEFVTITPSGDVGVGIASPLSILHVRRDVTGQLGPSLTLMNGNGGVGAGASIDFDGANRPAANPPAARIQSLDDGSWSSHLVFMTKNPGAVAYPLLERMRITNEGNVGIGTASPAYSLEVVREGNAVLKLKNTEPGASNSTVLDMLNNGEASRLSIGVNSTTHSEPNTAFFWMYNNFSMKFGTSGLERIRITGDGNVGIGTASPAARLEVAGGAVRVGGREVIDASGQALYG